MHTRKTFGHQASGAQRPLFVASALSALVAVGCGESPDSRDPGGVGSTTSALISEVTVHDLGAGSGSAALALNEAGVVVGGYLVGGDTHAFKWSGGTLTDIHSGGFNQSLATAINSDGLIGGKLAPAIAYAFETFTPDAVPAIWSDAGVAAVGPTSGQVFAINSSSQAIVWTWAQEGDVIVERSYFWSSSTGPVDIGHLGGGSSRATDINEDGTVVGSSSVTSSPWPHAFSWRLGEGMIDLGTLDGGGLSHPNDINDAGKVVGYAAIADNSIHAVEWVDGVIHDLNPPGAAGSLAAHVNNQGDVVGMHLFGESAPVRRATLWRDGLVIDLGAEPGNIAWSITDAGLVAGYGGASGAFAWLDSEQGPVLLPPLSGYAHSRGSRSSGNMILGHSFNDDTATGVATVWTIDIVTPPPPTTGDAIDDLQDDVDAAPLEPGESTSLDAKLDAALQQCARGNEHAAGNQIEAFIRHVEVLIRTNRITAEQGQALIASAESILATLECP